MTQVTEARLAREAELCYACLALVTDYDAWREEEEGVDAASVLEVMHANVDKAQRLLRQVVPRLLECAPALCLWRGSRWHRRRWARHQRR